MTTVMRVPDHVHEAAKQEAEEREITMMAVVEGWMKTAHREDDK